MNQITLRQVPARVYKQLRLLAKKNSTSINKTVLLLIQKSLGLEEGSQKMRDLGDLAGTWNDQEFREFTRILKDSDRIDDEVWK